MQDALDISLQKRRKDGRWPLQAKHAGQAHFDMETPGQPSRWNTLRALQVLQPRFLLWRGRGQSDRMYFELDIMYCLYYYM
jgi:hypothetical protein